MAGLKTVLKKYLNKKVVIKDSTNAKAGYMILEVGDSYIIAEQNKNVKFIFNLDHVVSVGLSERLTKTTKKLAKQKVTNEWESIQRAYKKPSQKIAK